MLPPPLPHSRLVCIYNNTYQYRNVFFYLFFKRAYKDTLPFEILISNYFLLYKFTLPPERYQIHPDGEMFGVEWMF